MRLGVDAWGLSGDLYFTGMGQYAARLVRGIARTAPDIAIVAYGAPGETRPAWLPPGVAWRPVGRQVPGKLSALVSRLAFLPRVLARDRIDVFHAPAVHMRPFFPPIALWRGPTVATLHDLIPLTYYDIRTLPLRQRVFYRWNLARATRADLLLTVSETSRAEILRVLGAPEGRVRAIHNGMDFAPRSDAGALARLGVTRPYVLYAGSYEPRKNLAATLTAFASLVDDGETRALVAIVERTSGHAPATLALVARLGPRLRLVHGLSDDDLRSLYTDADALVFPSLAEGFGFPPVQAAACGVPVVASDLPVLREILGDAAVYVDPRDPAAIAAGLRRVLDDPALAARLRDAGRARSRCFGEDEMALRHAEVFRAVAGPAPR